MIEPTPASIEVMLGKHYEGQDCAIASSLEVIGERWTLLIVRDALFGVRRFSDFHAHLDVPKAVLSERLNSLVEHGLLERRPDPDHPRRHFYELTDAGRELWPVLNALLVWGDHNRHPNPRVFKHVACGTPLDERAACPACRLTPPVEDVVMERRPGGRTLRDDPVELALVTPHRLLEPIDVETPAP
jgi:DNA-binding HxlR family transcriptional regulator